MIYIGIDPSINHTGWAIVQVTEREEKVVDYSLLSSGVVPGKKFKGFERINWIFNELTWAFGDMKLLLFTMDPSIKTAIIERPTFEKSGRGIQLRQQGFDKLCMATGACISAVGRESIPYAMITANQWKRGITKPTIKARVEELFPEKKGKWIREDEWEAAALACWGHAKRGSYEVYT